MSNGKYIAILVAIGIVLIVGSVMLGKSDNGEINVNDIINNSNKIKVEEGKPDEVVNTTPNKLRSLPNGGLVPQNPNAIPPTPTPEPEPGEVNENASTTETTSTDESIPNTSETSDAEESTQ